MRTMRIIAVAVLVGTSGFEVEVARARQEITRRDLVRRDLSVPGREVVQVRVEFAPGALASRHSHPGEEVAYVLEGVLEYRLDGQPPVTLKTGESLFIPAGVVHSAKNVGAATGAELATYIVERGKPLFVVAK